MTDSTPAPGGYTAALRELDGIVAELERGDVDVDRLAESVRRASELVRLCRERITGARLQVEQVITELDA
jgi:exodeoxyribonuclease VII small subunit